MARITPHKAQTHTALSGDECTNLESTVPPTRGRKLFW